MINFLKISGTWTVSIINVIFIFVPETVFEKYKLFSNVSNEKNVIINRIFVLIIVFILSIIIIINALCRFFRKSINIKRNNYSIKIKYRDIFKMRKCKKVIPFDECFTTNVGNSPSDIKPSSICGQYLEKAPIKDKDMQSLIDNAQLKPARSKSKFQGKKRYDSGKLVPNGDYLLMSFVKLDSEGLGRFFNYNEFIECLSILWREIDKYYGQKDVCIPILGSGLTRIENSSLTQQELLDIIIGSYKLSPYKIKSPYKLHIVCKKCDNFSLNKIGETI